MNCCLNCGNRNHSTTIVELDINIRANSQIFDSNLFGRNENFLDNKTINSGVVRFVPNIERKSTHATTIFSGEVDNSLT